MRRWWRHPVQTLVQVFSLGIGMAICLTAYVALDTLSFRSIPGIADRSSLVRVRWAAGPTGLSAIEFERGRPFFEHAFRALAVEGDLVRPISTPVGPATAGVAFVSPEYFEALETMPAAGRLLSAADAAPTGAVPGVISEVLWERAFGRAPIDGRQTIEVSNHEVTVVGVAPTSFPGLTPRDVLATDAPRTEVWVPMHASVEWRIAPPVESPWLMVAGRLPAGATVGAIRPLTESAASAMAAAAGGRREPVLQVFAAGGSWSDDPLRASLSFALFLFVPLCVLAIACANAVNLQLARAHERAAELTVRLALGSSRGALVRLLAADTLIVAGLSALAAVVATHAVAIASEGALEVALEIRLGTYVLVAALAALVVVASGVAPAWIAARETDVGTARRDATDGVRHQRLRLSLVALQLVVSTAMLFVSAVGVHSLARLAPDQPRTAGRTAILHVALDQARSAGTTPASFVAGVLAGFRAEPAIDAAAVADFDVEPGLASIRDADDPVAAYRTVSAGRVSAEWFRVMGTPLVRGREFSTDAEAGAVIVNRALARRLTDAVHEIDVRDASRRADARRSIVGVVDTPTLRRDEEAIFLPLLADPPSSLTVLARGLDSPGALDALRRVVPLVDARIPVDRIVTLERAIDDEAGDLRQVVRAGGVVSLAALFMAAAGIYALMAYSVERRTRELGIRIAIGAGRAAILRGVLRQTMLTSTVGIGAGLLIGAGLVAAMRAALFGLSPFDAAAFWPVVCGLWLVTLVASAVPAVRATRVDPVAALRTD